MEFLSIPRPVHIKGYITALLQLSTITVVVDTRSNRGKFESTHFLDEIETSLNTSLMSEDYISRLCPELQAQIFAYLTINDLSRTVALVCRTWNSLANCAVFRRKMIISSRHIKFVVNQESVMRHLMRKSPLLLDLQMYNINVSSLLPLVGKYCPKLRRLTLNDCACLDSFRIVIDKCPDLEYLSLGWICSKRICTKCIELCLRLSQIKKLKILQINDNELVYNDKNNSIIDYIVDFFMKIFSIECLMNGGSHKVIEATRIIVENTKNDNSVLLTKTVNNLLSSVNLLCLE